MESTPLHIRLDQKQEKLKSELDMQDDVVFKQIFIPGYGVSGIFVFVNGTMNYPAFNDIVLYRQPRLNPVTRFPSSSWSFPKSVQSGNRMLKHMKKPRSLFLTGKRFYL
ncbi:hypothetical protein [Peribacillus simplex]|uniref:hypothetical protein n=1 Tax=Peribacillus simplex TaxID=1478 RepID=UPI003D268A45